MEQAPLTFLVENMSKLELLQQFAEQIRKSYGAISSNISGVVEALNSGEEVDEKFQKHIEKIIAYLKLVEQKILVEKKLADNSEKLRLLKEEINNIKKLESYLKLAKTNSSHSVIVAINSLNNSLMALFARHV